MHVHFRRLYIYFEMTDVNCRLFNSMEPISTRFLSQIERESDHITQLSYALRCIGCGASNVVSINITDSSNGVWLGQRYIVILLAFTSMSIRKGKIICRHFIFNAFTIGFPLNVTAVLPACWLVIDLIWISHLPMYIHLLREEPRTTASSLYVYLSTALTYRICFCVTCSTPS